MARLNKKYIISIILLVFICGCTIEQPLSGYTVKEEKLITLKEITSEPLIYFCPKDNCESVLNNYINLSKESIHCALYDLNLDSTLDLFSEKSKAIDVKIVIDDNNKYVNVNGRGIIKDNNAQLMHQKFCIFDNSIVLTGSFNPTRNGANKNNNNIIIYNSQLLSKNYEDEFDELWNYNFGTGIKTKNTVLNINNKIIENYFCPEDNCKEHVIETLNKAEKSIYFMTFSFTDYDIADTLIEKRKDGIEIKGIMEKKRITMKYNQYKHLKNNNIDVIPDTNSATMHHKVFIIDDAIVITGSYNPTKNANENNDENILIIHDKTIAKKYLEEFNSLWNK